MFQQKKHDKNPQVNGGNLEGAIRQRAKTDNNASNPFIQMQKTMGNQATIKFLNERNGTDQQKKSDNKTIQRVINDDEVDKHKKTLGIEDKAVRILEVPKSAMLDTKIGDLNSKYKRNVDDLSDLRLADLIFGVGEPATKAIQDAQADVDADKNAAPYIELSGGAAYNNNFKLVVMLEANGSRDLLHEMGHFKQDLDGFDPKKNKVILLEYHNVLAHENLYEDGKLRTYYTTIAPKSYSAKTFEDVIEASSDEDLSLIKEIDRILQTDKYKDIEVDIKRNLAYEFFKK